LNDKRRFPRNRFTEPVGLKTRSEQAYQGCLGCDMSQGGLRLMHHDYLPLGQEVFLQVYLGAEDIRTRRARVVWSSQKPHSEDFLIGMEFFQPEIRPVVEAGEEPPPDQDRPGQWSL